MQGINQTKNPSENARYSKPQLGMETAAQRLHRLLLQSTRSSVTFTQRIGVAFSGGVDSSLVAYLAKECGEKVELITVGLGNTTEMDFAKDASRALNLPLHTTAYSIDDVEEAIPKVISLIENCNPINIGIAIPFFWVAQVAASNGLHVLLAGQGADELFGGYHRYLSIYTEKGAEILQQTMFHDFVSYYTTGFKRDNAVCAYHDVVLRLPYANMRVAKFASGLPLPFKIDSTSDLLRKRVLRKTAEQVGLPSSIVNRAKKAVQYATGVDKALCKLAKRENLNTSDYCKNLLKTISPDGKLSE